MSLALVGCDNRTDEQKYEDAQAASAEEVARYCLYGSESKSQYKGCIRHVEPVDITRGPFRKWTNAERFAVGLIDECRADAGPACVEGTIDEDTP